MHRQREIFGKKLIVFCRFSLILYEIEKDKEGGEKAESAEKR
jgi:hypothetical protein